ncbi:MAG: NMD3-related protein [Candidatus Methanomethylophilaceae archaeon]
MNFCVKCGKDCESSIDGLCIDCFLDGKKLTSMPHHTDLQVCTNCGEFRIHESWVVKDRLEAIEDAGIEQFSVMKEAKIKEIGAAVEEHDDMNYVVRIQALLDVSGVEVESEDSIIVRVKNTVCKRCSRYLGNYYESILQVRSNDKDLPSALRQEVIDRMETYVSVQSSTHRDIFITKIEIVHGGVDFYLSSIQLGKALAKVLTDSYSAESKEAAKLVGQTRDGQDMYRVTYLVRLPDFHVGDIIEYQKRIYVLTRVSNAGGKIIDLSNFKERSVKRTELNDIRVLLKSSEIMDAAVISRTGGEVQTMDPKTYRTVDVVVPEETEVGETIRVADIEGTLYYIPW